LKQPLTDHYPHKDPSQDDFPLDVTTKIYNKWVVGQCGKSLEDLLEEREAAPPSPAHTHMPLPPNLATPLLYATDALPASPEDLSSASATEAAPPGGHHIPGGFLIDAMCYTFSAEDQAILNDCLYHFSDDL
jgi:hypothetical protein